jgi:hypothetical protein
MNKFLNRPHVMITLYVVLIVFVVMDCYRHDWGWLVGDLLCLFVLFPRFQRVVIKGEGEDQAKCVCFR